MTNGTNGTGESKDAGAAVRVDEARAGAEDGGENDDGAAGRAAADTSSQGVVTAFGQTMKTLRVRAGLEREEFGRRIGYSASTVASFEQGRRIPSPRTIDRADEVLTADGLLTVWKDQVERAQYPAFFQGMAKLEKEAMELLMYDTLVVNGLLQTDEYMRGCWRCGARPWTRRPSSNGSPRAARTTRA